MEILSCNTNNQAAADQYCETEADKKYRHAREFLRKVDPEKYKINEKGVLEFAPGYSTNNETPKERLNRKKNEFITSLKSEVKDYNALVKTSLALHVSCFVHDDQERRSKESYTYHTIYVAFILLRMGVVDSDILSAALLHDTKEEGLNRLIKFFELEEADSDTLDKSLNKWIKSSRVSDYINCLTKSNDRKDSGADLRRMIDFNKQLIAEGKGGAIIMIKFADRLQSTVAVKGMDLEKLSNHMQSTLLNLLPLANSVTGDQPYCDEVHALKKCLVEQIAQNLKLLEDQRLVNEYQKQKGRVLGENFTNSIKNIRLFLDQYNNEDFGNVLLPSLTQIHS